MKVSVLKYLKYNLSGFLKFLRRGIAGLTDLNILKDFDTHFFLLSKKFVSKQIHHEMSLRITTLRANRRGASVNQGLGRSGKAMQRKCLGGDLQDK